MPRWGIYLPDDAWVVRGGLNKIETLHMNVETAIATLSRPAVSIWAAEVPDPIDLIEMSPLPHKTVCLSTAGRLRAAGFDDFEQTLDAPHHSVWLPWDWEPWLGRFRDAFDTPVPKSSLTRRLKEPDLSYGDIGWETTL